MLAFWASLDPALQQAVVAVMAGLATALLRHYHVVITPALLNGILIWLRLPVPNTVPPAPPAAASVASPAADPIARAKAEALAKQDQAVTAAAVQAIQATAPK